MESNSPKIWTVLVVDDQPAEAQPLIQRLGEEGWRVLLATSVREALQLVESHSPDAIICDLEMPVEGGYKLLEVIGNNPETHGMPFLLTNYDWDFTNWSLVAGGRSALCHVIKPHDHQRLREIVAILSRVHKSGNWRQWQ
jgi:CheY-like chemotaxis protein